ncbi:hypothetical protein ACGWY1_001914 [Enterococcus faecalis]
MTETLLIVKEYSIFTLKGTGFTGTMIQDKKIMNEVFECHQ